MKLFQKTLHTLSDRYRNKVRAVHLCDYLLFCVFSFAFLWGLQTEVVTLTLVKVFHYHYLDRSVPLAILLTLLLLCVKVVINRIFRLKGRRHALAFVPSFVLLALATSLVPEVSTSVYIITFAAIILWLIVVWKKRKGFRTNDTFWTLLQPNLLVFLCCFGYVTFVSNTDEVFHYELRVQRQLLRSHPDRALLVGKKSLATSPLLLSLRARALSEQNLLGESLFEYPIPARDTNLLVLPADSDRLLIAAPRNIDQSNVRLCTLLLQKRLDDFARQLLSYHPEFAHQSNVSLPKHYREALILYRSLFLHPRMVYQGSPEDVTNYNDFMDLCRQYPDRVERSNQARMLYGNTYWCYYYFHK